MAIAIEPSLLGGAIARVMMATGVDEIVSSDEVGSEHIDVAVVNTVRPDWLLNADVIIELPDTSGGTGRGLVRTARGDEPVLITGAATILEVLDHYCPGRSWRVPRDATAR